MYKIDQVYKYETPFEKGERYTLEAVSIIVACDMYTEKYLCREIEQGILRPPAAYRARVTDRLARFIYHLVEGRGNDTQIDS
jgi:hypothetical protein